jgi:hypothetical protein
MRVVNVNEVLHNPNGITKNIQTILGFHSHLFNIFIYNVDLIAPYFEINLAKLSGPIESIQQVVNVKHMIVVFYGHFIKSIVVNTHPQLFVLFINKQNWCPIR